MFLNAQIIWSSDEGTKTNKDLVLSMASSGYYSNAKQYEEKAALKQWAKQRPSIVSWYATEVCTWSLLLHVYKKQQLQQS